MGRERDGKPATLANKHGGAAGFSGGRAGEQQPPGPLSCSPRRRCQASPLSKKSHTKEGFKPRPSTERSGWVARLPIPRCKGDRLPRGWRASVPSGGSGPTAIPSTSRRSENRFYRRSSPHRQHPAPGVNADRQEDRDSVGSGERHLLGLAPTGGIPSRGPLIASG